jgi:hypothetical protein
MNIEKLNRWQWILLYASLSATIISLFLAYLSNVDVVSIIFGFLAFGIAVALGILIIIKPKAIGKQFRITLAILFGIGLILWFFNSYYLEPKEMLSYKWKWTIYDFSAILCIGTVSLFFLTHFYNTQIIAPFMIPIIVAGLVLNRLAVESEAYFMISIGFVFICTACLREAILALFLMKRSMFQKRLFFISCTLLSVCYALYFYGFANYLYVSNYIVELIGTILFFVLCIYLFVAMPFSNFVEWAEKTRTKFIQLILIPCIFLFILFSVRFVLPPETYKKLFFTEYAENKEYKVHFGMKDYKVKKPD